jgi:hypothetical protein
MSDTLDLTLLSGTVLEIVRELRLLRLQVDQLAAGLPPRMAVIEQSFHELVGEVSRGFGQTQQQITRLESRVGAVDAGLARLEAALKENTEAILRAIEARQ